MTREEAIYILKAIQALICPNNESVLENNFSEAFDTAIEALSADVVMRDVYDKRTQADEEIIDSYRQEFQKALSADAVDCTDFIEWLVDRVLDETIWEYNSVAYGEIICRKLEKLGVLEVTEEPSYYIRSSAEAVQGYTEWLEKIIVEAETFEWLCEDTTDEEWCEKNCNYASIQAECLRHMYEVSKGGDTE